MNQKQFTKEVRWLLEEKYDGKPSKAAEKDLARLRAGEPLDYIIGYVEFVRCKIDLSLKPLISRPETEYWVQKAIEDMQGTKAVSCLDIFSGSGCVGIAVLKHISQAHVDFIEYDEKLLQQIRLNLKENNILKKRYKIIHSDIFSRVSGSYDYIFANPPYIPESNKKYVQASVLEYEPKQALFAGKDGLKYIKKFLKQAKDHLTEKGIVYMEFDFPQKKDIEQLLKQYGYSAWQFHRDQYKKWRFVIVKN